MKLATRTITNLSTSTRLMDYLQRLVNGFIFGEFLLCIAALSVAGAILIQVRFPGLATLRISILVNLIANVSPDSLTANCRLCDWFISSVLRLVPFFPFWSLVLYAMKSPQK